MNLYTYWNYPNADKACISYGEGIEKIDENDIKHLCNTQKGSSGGPILSSLTNKVIGIHKGFIKEGYNIGTFLKSVLDELNPSNYIISDICVPEIKDINTDIKIIGSYGLDENECEIEIDDQLIPFNYYYKFKDVGYFTIKYSFSNNLTNTDNMFNGCSCIKNIDLSNLNTKNITSMNSMFKGCSSLMKVDLTKFNSQNVKDMSSMFYCCKSLKYLDLSNFNTQNVTSMNSMFEGCLSLTNLDLSNFNTQNVTSMNRMFEGCESLTNIDLSNFNTQNIKDMSFMLYWCKSLKNLELSNFDTQNIKSMSYMFNGWSSLLKENVISKVNKFNKIFDYLK